MTDEFKERLAPWRREWIDESDPEHVAEWDKFEADIQQAIEQARQEAEGRILESPSSRFAAYVEAERRRVVEECAREIERHCIVPKERRPSPRCTCVVCILAAAIRAKFKEKRG